jgi:hypothetical protein
VNSHDTKSRKRSGSNTSLLKKINAIFHPKLDDVPKPTSAGSNSSSVSSQKQTTQSPGMFMPLGISDLKLTEKDITALINSPILSNGEQTALKTYTQTSGTANNMNDNLTINDTGITYAVIKNEEAPPREHFFYAYQQSEGGMWFNTILAESKDQAAHSLTYLTKPIHRKKLCCVML